jgi:hypothetical protein
MVKGRALIKKPKTMRKYFFTLAICFSLIFSANVTKADEGMWLPIFVKDLNYEQMQEMGLQLTAEEIYSINNSSLKDAIVNFGNFCTAEVVSTEGLLFTNHHCGYGAIQDHSTIEFDYLTDGFWAYSKEEELANPGLTATFFVRMEDVTEKVLSQLSDDMTEPERAQKVKEIIAGIEAEASEEGRYDAQVRDFFYGNEYYLFIYETFKDVRLVGAPPSSIGKYGGDTDNWMWPRHTGDFSVFRIYTAPDGSPAEYSKDNVPFQAKYHLPISLEGIEREDFTMIWGYPGSTDRYRTSQGIELTLDQINPAIDEAFTRILGAMKEEMNKDNEVRIKYADSYAGLANMWKNKRGESRGLKRLNVYQKKKDIENELDAWIKADADRKAKYGTLISDIETSYKTISDSKYNEYSWYILSPLYASNALRMPMTFKKLQKIADEDLKKDALKEQLNELLPMVDQVYAEYDVRAEKAILKAAFAVVKDNTPAELMPAFFETINKDFKGDTDAYVDYLFEESIYTSAQAMKDFIAKPKMKKVAKDPLAPIFMDLLTVRGQLASKVGDAENVLSKSMRTFVAALREMNPEKAYYPDANFTMRLTYGEVLDYYPADAIHYDFTTTIDGVMEKEDPTNDEFIVAPKLKELYENKDYGRYADKNGNMTVCFLSNNDITGGNSGSPVINGRGELIGIAFDGNWEAMSGDIAFEPELQRTISVDIRYVLFVIDKYAGAKNLIEELTVREKIVPLPPVPQDVENTPVKAENVVSE